MNEAPNTSAPMIDCRNLTKRYRSGTALDALNWQVAPGTVTALLGKNGAGKTTVLRLLVNLLSPTRGEAWLLGKPASKLTSADFARLGYVAESQSLPEWMTVGALMRYLAPMYPTWDVDFCNRLLGLFELPSERKISQLSRGMRLKTAFVSSLAYHPEVLLLDEPFSGLDSVVREDVMDALLELTEQEKWTIVISSHDVDEIERLVDHVAILNHGRLLWHTPIETLLNSFREISFRIEDKEHAEKAPLAESWISYQYEAGRVRLVETVYHSDATLERLRQHFPGHYDLEISTMTLKAAYVAMLRARKDCETPNQHALS